MSTKFNQKKILVVEDSKLTNQLISDKLSESGHIIKQAYTIKESISHLKREEFDYVTLDLVLPDGSGEQIIKLLNKEYPKVKAIVFTANDSNFDRFKLFNQGIVDYFVKDDLFRNSINEITDQIQQIENNVHYTILIVDNSTSDKAHLKNILKTRNFNLKIVSNAEDALMVLDTFTINLIITDIKLPVMNGIDFIHSVKKSKYSNTPIIVLSSIIDSEITRKCYKLKVVEFLNKPSSSEEILLKVDFWIEKYNDIKELNNSNKILQEYKDAIDESSIVSKADTRGFITYVNRAFCEISGYQENELVGNTHNILKHIDTPKDLFEDLWKTITSKKVWHGIIKNRKKDGTHYWVNSTIKPILDSNGYILEYISIRNDITEIQDYKQILDDTLEEKDQTLEDNINYIVQYENAVSNSSAIVRTGLDFTITYVNDIYTELTGYSKDEMVGENQLKFLDKEMENVEDAMKVLQEGLTYTNTFKGIKKSGEPYYTVSTIAPIKDKKGNPLEYLIIKNDITTEMNLTQEIEETQKEVVFTMGAIGETRSKETGLHVKRVAEYSYLLGKLYGLNEEDAQLIKQASPMHDIGKVAIPDSILNKPGKLTEDEFEIMKTHSELGYNMLKASTRPILKTASIIAYSHHEKWNGSGYPNGLKGEEIDISARITAVADVFDALGHNRVYKKAWPLENILELYKNESGKHFDPKLIDIFFENLDKFLGIKKSLDD